MDSITFELIIILILVFLNGIFSMSEIAVISSRKARLIERAKNGDKGAQSALNLSNSPNRFLSTIQVGITFIGILMGAFGGSTLAQELIPFFRKFHFTYEYAETISLAIIVFFVSYLSLIFGELIPKRLALSNAEIIAKHIARPMTALSLIAYPFVFFLSKTMDTIFFILRIRETKNPAITQEEISHAIDLGRIAGLVEPDEQRIVKRVLDFGERQIHTIMTPRTDVSWLDINDPFDRILKKIAQKPYSRFPVIRGSPDTIIGVIKARDLLEFSCSRKGRLEDLIVRPVYIPQHATALHVVELLRLNPLHLAIIIDEFGGFLGIVTPYDILQALIGELPQEQTMPYATIQSITNTSWVIDGSLPVQEFKLFFDINDLPDEHKYGTLSGLVLYLLGHIPVTNESFEWKDFTFTILNVYKHRIENIRVDRTSQSV